MPHRQKTAVDGEHLIVVLQALEYHG